MSEQWQIINVGSVRVERGPKGEISVWWPDWHLGREAPATHYELTGGAGIDLPELASFGGGAQRIILGTGEGPHVTLSNVDGKAEETLRSIRVGVNEDGSGWSVADLERIAQEGA